MDKISIQVETVTACFLHVQPDGPAIWRAAPFRGITRWWFRALTGAWSLPAQVREMESDLFGTAFGESVHQSKVSIRLLDVSGSSMQEFAVNPKPDQKPYRRKALPPRSRATLEIVPTRRGSTDDVCRAYCALWTAIHLGGIGQRCRRGAGSLSIINTDGLSGLPGAIAETKPEDYAKALEAGLDKVRRLLGAHTPRPIEKLPEFPVLHPKHASIIVARGPKAQDETAVRRELMTVRRAHHRKPAIPGEFEFGCVKSSRLSSPVWCRCTSESNKTHNSLVKSSRLSSPVWCRIASIPADGPIVVLTLMKHQPAHDRGARWEFADNFMKDPRWEHPQAINLGGI